MGCCSNTSPQYEKDLTLISNDPYYQFEKSFPFQKINVKAFR
jgi:hypothetical protein